MIKRLLDISAVTASLILAAAPATASDDTAGMMRFCKLGAKDAPQAIYACTTVLENGDPSLKQEALLSRGLAYTSRRWYAQALADFDALVKLNPKMSGAWNSRGWVYLKTGRPREALADFDRALSLEKGEKYMINREAALKAIAEAQ
ncbi:tetratricopeptide repeat protein [Microvirga makkahensis]|uniref:Tetratricopeptide repeat protein n=1 Tax=Microvirga makkahensis TaxID=1128670 RepID=A0A7X3SQS4_9HYPH|nr:tetratricopeptide repeat protein [Microvirga makkahensis]MXQ13817.1 tetratricopeptide repeat protein [Microvirga makkahensis]